MKIADTPRSLPQRVIDYTKPRPGVGAGDAIAPIPSSGALMGGIQGYVASGLSGGAAGAIGGFVGIKAGEATNSMPVALATGAATGAAASAALGLGLTAVFHPELISLGHGSLIAAGAGALGGAVLMAARGADKSTLDRLKQAGEGAALGVGAAIIGSGLLQVAQATGPAHLIGPALLGGFIGAVGTLSGDRRALVRDGVYGGMMLGGIAGLVTHNPLMMVVGAAGAGIAGRAVKPLGRVVLGSLAGAAAGAIAGAAQGPGGIIAGAVAGSLVAPAGALLGPPVRQAMRNATVDLSTSIISKMDPYLQAHPLNHAQKVALGATLGAISVGSIGRVAGWEVAGVAAGVGAVGGAIQVERILRKREKVAKEQGFLQKVNDIAFGQPLDLATLSPAPKVPTP